jgi:hypothetical protein
LLLLLLGCGRQCQQCRAGGCGRDLHELTKRHPTNPDFANHANLACPRLCATSLHAMRDEWSPIWYELSEIKAGLKNFALRAQKCRTYPPTPSLR